MREALSETRLVAGRRRRRRGNCCDFFLLEKAFYEIEYELTNRPTWAHIPLEGDLAHP